MSASRRGLCTAPQLLCDAETLSLNVIVAEAKEHNPQILSAKKDYFASEEIYNQAVSLEDPRLTAGYFGENVETRVGPQLAKYSISQKFPFFGKLSLKGRIAFKERDIALQKYLTVEQEVIRNLKYAFFDLYAVRESISKTQEIKGLMEEVEKAAESKYSSGIASEQDVLKAQVEISNLMAKLYTLFQREAVLSQKINTLLNRPKEISLGQIEELILTELPSDPDKLMGLAEIHRPEMAKALSSVEKNEQLVLLKKKDYFPDFTLGVDYIVVGSGHTNAANDGQDAWMGMVSVNLPLWHGRIKSGVTEAENKLASSRSSYQDIRNEVSFQIKDSLFRKKTAADLVDLYKNALIPQAQESLKAARAGYETGKNDFLNLMDSERVLLNFRIAYYQALSDHEKSVADLERAVGLSTDKIRESLLTGGAK